MKTREKAHQLIDELSDAELEEIVPVLEALRDQPDMAELPASWRTLPSGEPAPNWVAAVHEAREGR
jgi:hypothetical protein